MNETENDLWRVKLADGDMQAMTLDALDDAFQAGTIDENTLVLAPGATGWTKLADMAGLDDSAPAVHAPVEYSVNSLAPIAVDTSPASIVGMPPVSSPASLAELPDLDLLDDNALKPKKGRVFAFIGVAVLLVGGLGFAATKLAPVTASAATAMQAEAQLKNAANQMSAPSSNDGENEASKRLQQLTEEQRVKLLEADKAREAAAAAKAKEKAGSLNSRPSPSRRGPAPKGGQPFHNGGDKFDPLNGAL